MNKKVGITLRGVTLDNIAPNIDENMMKELLNDHELYLGFVRNFNLDIETVANLTRERDALKYLLQEYKDLEEQGLLLRLPCKVGDTVWYIPSYNGKPLGFINKDKVQMIGFTSRGIHFKLREHHEHNKMYMLGKSVFLTRAEAEQKLKEMEEND